MKRLLLLPLLSLLLQSTFLTAAQGEGQTVYVIRKGDTLSGLSSKFLNDPKYWPELWSRNRQITNPHYIYPGHEIRTEAEQVTSSPVIITDAIPPSPPPSPPPAELKKEEVTEKTYTLYGTEGYIAETGFKPYGLVLGTYNSRSVAAIDDIVYTDVGADAGGASGDKFSIFSAEEPVKHPSTNDVIGFKLIPTGTLQLTDVDQKTSRAIVTGSLKEIVPGSYLMPYREKRRREIPLRNSAADLKGQIVEAYSGVGIIASGDVVYVDLGTDHGAEAGNMLYIVRDVKVDRGHIPWEIEKLPHEPVGALVILETGRKLSVAVVVKSVDVIYKGDRIVSNIK